ERERVSLVGVLTRVSANHPSISHRRRIPITYDNPASAVRLIAFGVKASARNTYIAEFDNEYFEILPTSLSTFARSSSLRNISARILCHDAMKRFMSERRSLVVSSNIEANSAP